MRNTDGCLKIRFGSRTSRSILVLEWHAIQAPMFPRAQNASTSRKLDYLKGETYAIQNRATIPFFLLFFSFGAGVILLEYLPIVK